MIPGGSGIYAIVNSADGRLYVGQSTDMSRRVQDHTWALKTGRHFNKRLQAAYTAVGGEWFEFKVLEATSVEMLDLRERAWIAYFGGPDGGKLYNFESGGHELKQLSAETRAKISSGKMGSKLSAETIAKRTASRAGWRPSAEHIACIVAATKGKRRPPQVVAAAAAAHRGLRHTEEARAKMSASQRGRVTSQETIAKIVQKTRGLKRSPEALARMSAAQCRPEVRALKSRVMKEALAQKRARLLEEQNARSAVS